LARNLGTDAMKRFARLSDGVAQCASTRSPEILRENIPLRDMSDCLLAVYEEVSRRALQRGTVRGAQVASEREEWKAAEDDLFVRISVDFEESGANLYALASLPGCAGGEITVAVDACWLLISGYAEHGLREHGAKKSADGDAERADAQSDYDENAPEQKAAGPMDWWEGRDGDPQGEGAAPACDEDDQRRGAGGLRAPRPFCVVALRAKVDPGRSVAVLSNGLLAIRMGKAPLDSVIPRVA
jgi:HSP20 family molecular chaperone IbpA